MEGKPVKSAVKQVLILTTSIVLGLTLVKLGELGIKKVMKKV